MAGLYVAGSLLIGLSFQSLTPPAANKLSAVVESSSNVHRSIHLFYEDIFPSALRAGSWHYVWGSRLLQEHLLVNVISSMVGMKDLNNSARLSLTSWTLVMGKSVVYLFVSCCVVMRLMYEDDGFCGDQSTESSCRGTASTTGYYFRTCEWYPDDGYCAFPNTFGTIMVLTFLVTLFSSPIYQLMEACIGRRHIQTAVLDESRSKQQQQQQQQQQQRSLKAKHDEFHTAPGFRATLMRGARLSKIQQTADRVSSADEARWIVEWIASQHAETTSSESTVLSNSCAKGSGVSGVYYYDHDLRRHGNCIQKMVETSLKRSNEASVTLTSLASTEEGEEFLMSSFIVDSFYGCKRRIAAKHFLERFARKTRSDQLAAIEYLSIGVFVGMVVVMIYFIVYSSTIINSRSIDLWLIIALVSFFEDLIILQPLIVWINWAMIDVPVARDAREMVDYLSKRSRFIMMRTANHMCHTGALVQHFNSACRTARMFPALPVSRLLFSLNDSDVPLHKPFNYLYALTQMTAYLQRDVQAVVLNVALLVLLNVTAILCFQLRAVSSLALYVLLASIAGLIVAFGCFEYKPIKLPVTMMMMMMIAPNDDDEDVEGGRKGSVSRCRESTAAVHRPLLELSEVLPREVTASSFAGEHFMGGAEESNADKSTNELTQGCDDNAGSSAVVKPQLQGYKTFEYIYIAEPAVEEGRNPARTATTVDRSGSYASWTDRRSKGSTVGASGRQASLSSQDDLLIDDFSRSERLLSRYRPRDGIDRLLSNRQLAAGGGNSLVSKVQTRLGDMREMKSNRFKVKRSESNSSSWSELDEGLVTRDPNNN